MANHRSLGSLGRRLRRIARDVNENATDVVRGAALVADQVVVQSTPVLTGRARSGWDVEIGSEPTSVPSSDPSTPEAGTNEALQKGRNVISQWETGDGIIYISNGLAYIRRLEEGYSAQAPAGMTADAATAARDFVRQQRLLRGS